MGRAILIACLALLLAAGADPGDRAADLLRRGEFRAAAEAGQGLDTADGLAVAAKALLVLGAYELEGPARVAAVHEAEQAARRALALDPDHVDARLHLVVALGYRARIEGKAAAQRRGYGGTAKRLLDEAARLAPEDPWAHAIRGGWHAEVVAVGGPIGALLFGASMKKAHSAFRRAINLDPANPGLRVEYAKAMLFVDRDLADAAAAQLAEAAKHPPRDAFEAILARQGEALRAAIRSGNRAAIVAALDAATPFLGADRARLEP